jgi:hypothetical protein
VPRPFLPAALAALVALPALAQAPASSNYVPPKPEPGFVAPKFSDAWWEKMRRLPDFNGSWSNLGGYVFNAENKYTPPDPAGGEGGVRGPNPGTKNLGMPYNAKYQKIYDDAVRQAVEEGVSKDPVGNCMQPYGMPRSLGGAVGGPEIFVTPDVINMTWGLMDGTRRIYTDGRPHPSGDDLWPTYYGHSIGHWEGDVLVVHTTGLLPGIYDQTGAPYSGKLQITERWSMIAKDVLRADLTFEDPEVFTRPWQVSRYFRRNPPDPTALLEYYCIEQNTSFDESGAQGIILPFEKDAK